MKIIVTTYLLLLPHMIIAEQPNWEIVIMNGDTLLADELISIGRETLEYKYQKLFKKIEIDKIISISTADKRYEKKAIKIGSLGFIITLGFIAVIEAFKTDCGVFKSLTSVCKFLIIASDTKKLIKTGIISLTVGALSYSVAKLSGGVLRDTIVLDGASTFDRISEINKFYAKHNPNKTLY